VGVNKGVGASVGAFVLTGISVVFMIGEISFAPLQATRIEIK
jgi:hypothetical protein